MASYYSHNSSSSSPNSLISSTYPKSSLSLEIHSVTDYPICSELTTIGIRAVDSPTASMTTNAAFDELNRRIDELDRTQKESHQRQEDLALKQAELLKKVDQHYEQPSAGYLQSIRELILEFRDERDGVSAGQGHTPESSSEVLGSFPTINCSHRFDESKMIEDEIVVKLKPNSGDLSSVEGKFQSTPHQNEDDDSLDGMSLQFEEVSKTELIGVSKLIQVKIDKVHKIFRVLFNNFEKNFESLRCLKDLLFLYNFSNCVDCVCPHLGDTRSLFDRGKCSNISSISYENLVTPWILSLGYQSDFRYIHLVVSPCVNDAASHDERMLLVEMIVRIRHVLLLLCRVMEMEKVLEPQGIMLGIVLWNLNTGGACLYNKMPVTDLSSQMMKCLNAAGNLVLFQVYFHMFTLATMMNCLKLIGPYFFLHYSCPVSMICGSVTTLSEGIQINIYPAEVQSRAVGSQSWFTAIHPPYVLLVVTPLSYELISTVFYSVRILLTQLLDLWISPTMIPSWAKPLMIGVNLLGWSDTHILLKLLISEDYEKILMSKRVAHYEKKHCNTRSQGFKNDYLIMLLRQCPHWTFTLSKVYFFIPIRPITFICASLPTAEYCRIIFDRGKDFYVLRSGYSVYELALELGLCFAFLFKSLNVFLYDKNGDYRDASKIFYGRPQQGINTWTVLDRFILLKIRVHEHGNAPAMFSQVLVKDDSSSTRRENACKEFTGQGILSANHAMLLVRMLNFVHLYPWIFLADIELSLPWGLSHGLFDLIMSGNSEWSLIWDHYSLQLKDALYEKNLVVACSLIKTLIHKRVIMEIFLHNLAGSVETSLIHFVKYHWANTRESLVQHSEATELQHNWGIVEMFRAVILLASEGELCIVARTTWSLSYVPKRGFRRVEIKRGNTTINWAVLDDLISKDKLYKLFSQMHMEVVSVEGLNTLDGYRITNGQYFHLLLFSHTTSVYIANSPKAFSVEEGKTLEPHVSNKEVIFSGQEEFSVLEVVVSRVL